ncbi:MAG: 3-dehydroquinate synthase II [Armatimonadota bacterium]
MKRVWVRIEPWDKQLAIAALESGADAVILAEGDTPRMKELGALPTVAPDGDIEPGRDVFFMQIASKADESAVATTHLDKPVVLTVGGGVREPRQRRLHEACAQSDWTIIPLENLISQRGNLMVEVADAEQAHLMIGIMEKGVDGVVLNTRDPSEVRKAVALVHAVLPKLDLVAATVTAVRPLGMGDRACVDTVTNMEPGEGMLVGNSGSAFLLVHSETVENPYVATRPFRVNAGAVHAYVLLPDDKTKYLGELKSGDEVLIVRHDGRTQVSYVGRNKVERRPMLLVEAEADGQPVSLVLQNAETIRLTAPDGAPVSVAALKPGDQVLAYLQTGGRHFGAAVEETITER